jgi:hypothetical protein
MKEFSILVRQLLRKAMRFLCSRLVVLGITEHYRESIKAYFDTLSSHRYPLLKCCKVNSHPTGKQGDMEGRMSLSQLTSGCAL